MGLGNILLAVGKGIGKAGLYIGNEVVKQATGVDLKEELGDTVQAISEGQKAFDDVKDLEKNKNYYIEEFGEEAYKEMLEEAKIEAEFKLQEAKGNLSDAQYNIRGRIEQENDRRRNLVREKLRNLSDSQLKNLNTNGISEEYIDLYFEERDKRGI